MSNPKAISSLSHHPDMAMQVGLVVADYAVIERLFYTLYALLAEGNVRQNLTDFYRLRSTNRQKQAIFALANGQLDKSHYKAVVRLLRRFATAADRRTEVAHCVYLADANTCLRLQLSADEAVFVPLENKLFEYTFNQYRTLSKDVVTALALLASALGRQEKLDQAMHVLPRPQALSSHPEVADNRDHLTQFDTAEHKASLARLGLLKAYYPEG